MIVKKHFAAKDDSLICKFKSYSALTSAFLAASSYAHAQIIYTDINPDVIVQDTTFDIDMDGDGTTDYIFWQLKSSNGNARAVIYASNGHYSNMVIAKKGNSDYYYPSRLSQGAVIGPGGGFLSFQYAPFYGMYLAYAYATGNLLGYWNGSAGYVGVKFISGGNNFYGWIACEVGPQSGSITIKGFAYEATPNTLIHAGDTASTINPGINENTNTLNQVGNFFPNPASKGKTKILIESKESADLKIEVMNGMGQLLQTNSRRLISGKNMVSVNLNDLANGIYFVKLTSGNQSVHRKINVSM